MSRRRSTPWIHRWSRQIIGAIAGVGALLTGYLTVTKLTGGNVACTASTTGAASCHDVLSSPYATVFGLPLSLFGCLAYLSMAVFALAPLTVNSEQNKQLRSKLEDWTWLLLFAGATAMTVFSGYLMYLLAFKINAVCLYCIGSALFSTSLLVLSLIGHTWEDAGQLLFTGIVVGMVTLISTLGIYANLNSPKPPNSAATGEIMYPITSVSGTAELELANYLKQQGVKMYGAYWCPHCHEQKQLFGKEAFSQVPYVECADPTEPQKQTDACRQAKIESYPTWEIKGKLNPGVKTLEEIANLTGYKGSRNFKYTSPPM